MSRRKRGVCDGVIVLRYSTSEAVSSFAAAQQAIPMIRKKPAIPRTNTRSAAPRRR